MSTPAQPDHYAVLGLERGCSGEQIRAAYRFLAKRHHPDVNSGETEALLISQRLNAAHETLSDPTRRADYDREIAAARKTVGPVRAGKVEHHIFQEVNLKLEDFFRGTLLDVRVNDPANPHGPETYRLTVPPLTAPGTWFRIPREEPFAGGFVQVRVRALPNFRFKARGSDLRCDLKLRPERAAQGGTETVPGITGGLLRVPIPRGAARGEIVRVAGEGLPKPRGGRGDLLVRLTYPLKARITRAPGH